MAWDLLTNVYQLPANRLYVTYFGGDDTLRLRADTETRDLWRDIGCVLRYLGIRGSSRYLTRYLSIRSRKVLQGSKLRGAEGQNAPKLSPNAPRLLNLGAKFCYPIQPDICFEA